MVADRHIDVGICRSQIDLAAARHRVPCVDEDVEQNLFDLGLVDLDRPHPFEPAGVYANFFFGAAEHSGRPADQFIEVGDLDLVLAAPGESQQLPGKGGTAFDVPFYGLDFLIMRMLTVEGQEHQGGIALHAHENVVEIMRNTAGQIADGLHFLGLDQLLLEFRLLLFAFYPFGHIPHHAAVADRLPFGISQRVYGQFKGHLRIVLADHEELGRT